MLALALGCSTTSTIMRVNDFPIEAEVVGGSPDTIFVAREDGVVRELPRSEITDVDYPGNVHATVGGVLAGYGILNVAVAVDECDSSGAAYCAGVFTPLIVGALMTVWGFAVHQEQVSAVADTSMQSNRPRNPGRTLRPRRARPRPAPDTRPVAPLPVELEEDKAQEPPAAPTPPSPPALPPADAPASPAPPSAPSSPAPPSATFPPDR